MARNNNYTFHGQRHNEAVLLVLNRHTWTFSPVVFLWLVLLVILALVMSHFGASFATSLTIGLILVIGGFYTFYKWFLWRNGVYIITDQRVVKVDQLGLFSRSISEAEVDRIQEISTEISGPIKTMLNFGTVRLQTASNTTRVELKDVPDPYSVQQEIVRVQRQGIDK